MTKIRRCLAQLATTPARLIDKLRSSTLARGSRPAIGRPRRSRRSAGRQPDAKRALGIGPREYRVLHGGR